MTIPKSTNEARLVENFKSVNVKLTPGDMERLKGLDKGLRLNPFDWLFKPAIDTVDSAWDVKEDGDYVM